MNKDPEMTKKELTALCRKQEEYIKELEDKIYGTLSDSEKCVESAKPDYDELLRENQKLYDRIYQLVDEIEALKWSLIKSHNEMISWKEHCIHWEENYDKEHKRAEKLYEELNKNDK